MERLTVGSAVGSGALNAAVCTWEDNTGGHHYLHYLHHSLASGQTTGREGDTVQRINRNWSKDLLSMAPPTRTRLSFRLSQSLLSGNFHKPFIL